MPAVVKAPPNTIGFPPILLMVVLNVPVPLPFTSPVKAINWSPEFTPPTVTSPTTVKVVFVFVPPVTLNPFVNAVGVTPFIDLFFKASVPVRVATDNPLTNILESTTRLVFTNNVSVIVAFPLTYKEESIFAFNLSALVAVSNFNKSATSFVVANVPDVGKITLLAPVVVTVRSPIPLVIILLPKVIVFPALFTPVPPFEPGSIELMVVAESANLAFSAVNA